MSHFVADEVATWGHKREALTVEGAERLFPATTNTSGLAPLGFAVLIKPYQPERKESLIVIPDAVSDKSMLLEDRAVVIEVGPAAWPNEPKRAKPGDKVLVSKYAGRMAVGTADGQQYRFVNDQDIFALITGECLS